MMKAETKAEFEAALRIARARAFEDAARAMRGEARTGRDLADAEPVARTLESYARANYDEATLLAPAYTEIVRDREPWGRP